jgi:hypothetical protein
LAVADLALARRLSQPAPAAPVDYRERSGFPLARHEMRGIARCDFVAPTDMRLSTALRPWTREVVAQAPQRNATG